jgi:hypothetical protein
VYLLLGLRWLPGGREMGPFRHRRRTGVTG